LAHDFNNLLTVIGGYCQLLLSDETVPRAIAERGTCGPGAAYLPRHGTLIILNHQNGLPVLEYVRTVLGQLGYTLLEAANGAEALEVAHNHPSEISLLLSDIVMAQMHGPQLTGFGNSGRPSKVL
jgi:hypothetical protein